MKQFAAVWATPTSTSTVTATARGTFTININIPSGARRGDYSEKSKVLGVPRFRCGNHIGHNEEARTEL